MDVRRSDVDEAAAAAAAGGDRITKLPEPLLHHILSSFLVKDVAQIGTLSKVLYNAWNAHPYLDFGNDFFRAALLEGYYFSSLVDKPELLNVIDQILTNRQNRKISIHKFRIYLDHPCWISCVDDWINKLIACSIKEFHLKVGRPISEEEYTLEYNSLPESIFAAKPLNVLSLDGFKIRYLPSIGIKFSSLREFYLNEAFLDDQFIQALCTSCSHLEVMSLQRFKGLTKFQVGDTLPKLHTVTLHECPPEFQVDIVAATLECLEIHGIHDDIKLVKINACKALKTLHLQGLAVADEWFVDLVSSLINLETFSFFSNTLKTLKITSDRLKWLSVYKAPRLTFVELDTPNLIRLQYRGSTSPTFKMNKASVLLDAFLNLDPVNLEIVDSDWHSKLIELLVNFNHSKSIRLSCKSDEMPEIIIPKDVRENFTHPLYGTKILQVDLQSPSDNSVRNILDSMLWISPHLETLSFTRGRGVKTLKFVYEDASDEDEKPCCASLPWKCWRRKLKKVELQNFTFGEQESLKDYFSKNVDISDLIEISPECSP